MNSRRPVNSTVRAHRSFKNHKRNARLVAGARRAANVDFQIPGQDEWGSRRPRFPFLATEVTRVARYNGTALEQFVGRERRERVSQLALCGGGGFDSRRRVNSTVIPLRI